MFVLTIVERRLHAHVVGALSCLDLRTSARCARKNKRPFHQYILSLWRWHISVPDRQMFCQYSGCCGRGAGPSVAVRQSTVARGKARDGDEDSFLRSYLSTGCKICPGMMLTITIIVIYRIV